MKRRKPRRVVLGTGWLYAQLGNPTWISLRRADPKPQLEVLAFSVGKLVWFWICHCESARGRRSNPMNDMR